MSVLASYYPCLKQLHVTTVMVSGLLFALRYAWMLRDSLSERGPWVRTLPHVNDSFLLLSGLAMASVIQQYPLLDAWLSAKLFALLSYIVLGSVALKRGRTKRIRRWAGTAAILCYLYIVSSALSRSPIPSMERILQVFTF